jgi:arsenate reductase (thioredoxin)
MLFVCVENAGRSQMAEGFFRKYAPREYDPVSAGIKPVSRINPLAVQAMNEIGIDIPYSHSYFIFEISNSLL